MPFPIEIAEALVEKDICNSVGKTKSLSGGSINDAYRVETDRGALFVKINTALNSSHMFDAENESLLALSTAVPSIAPKPLLHAPLLERGDGAAFLATEFVPLASGSGSAAVQRELARRLARLHETESPTGMFGFHVDTMCGSTRQENEWMSQWEEFFRERRLRALVRLCVRKWGPDAEVEGLVGRLCEEVVPVVVGCLKKVRPVLLHGDLWSGNWGVNSDTGEPVIFDPSSYYGHNEMELGIMKMAGNFSAAFYDEYHKHHPRAEPYFTERLELYELYHHLNHWHIFGGGYRHGAVRIMQGLIERVV